MTAVEVFADVACPFTHVGLRRFVERRAASGRSDVRLIVRAWPLEIVNGVPLDPDLVAEEIGELRAQVAPDLFEGFRAAGFPSTSMPALALAAAAYGKDEVVGEAISLDLRDQLFEQGRDISDPVVLESVAACHGLDVEVDTLDQAPVLADHAVGIEAGVVGSPHFLVREHGWFCPGLSVGRDEAGHLHIATDPDRFERFLDQCFAPVFVTGHRS